MNCEQILIQKYNAIVSKTKKVNYIVTLDDFEYYLNSDIELEEFTKAVEILKKYER